jgi:two-component system NtrC family sensor kinase
VPSLLVVRGHATGSRFDLSNLEGRLSIGRETGNLVQLRDNEVSRRHAEVRRVGDSFVIDDLRSSNGTFVNNRRIERATLSRGDRVQIGGTLLVYAGDDDDEAALVAAAIIPERDEADGSRIIRSMSEADATADPIDTRHHRLAQARRNVQVMYRTALAASHTLDIDELLGRILELVFEWVEADRGCIMLVDPATGGLETKARRDRQPVAATALAISRTILDYVLDRGEGVLTSDAQDDDRFASGHSIVRTGVREAICVPLRGRYGTVGVIYVDTTVPLAEAIESGQRRFSDEHLKLMIAIGHQAALAVEDTRYYSAMVQSERLAAIGQTIATLSHHIKNILQGIRGGSYLVEMGLDNDDVAVLQKGWDIVRRNQNKISSLVMDMLSFSKEREPDPMPSDLGALIDDILETVQQRIEEGGVTVRWNRPADLPRLVFDPEGLSRAVLNVVSNALDAVEDREAPRIEIAIHHDAAARTVRITVADNGAGMDAATLAGIFELFMSTKGGRGTGLGLTVSRKILREHGGDITATSTPGVGSTFVLEFPLQVESAADRGTRITPAAP